MPAVVLSKDQWVNAHSSIIGAIMLFSDSCWLIHSFAGTFFSCLWTVLQGVSIFVTERSHICLGMSGIKTSNRVARFCNCHFCRGDICAVAIIEEKDKSKSWYYRQSSTWEGWMKSSGPEIVRCFAFPPARGIRLADVCFWPPSMLSLHELRCGSSKLFVRYCPHFICDFMY